MNSTVYDVQVRYGLDDKASAALENLGRTAERTERHVGGLREGLETLAEVFLVKEGLSKAKEWFVDANSEMEQMKINLAAVSSYNLKKPFAEAAEQTDKLIAGWQQFSKSTTLTTKQFTEFGAALEGPVLNATGGNMKIFDEIVKRGAVVGNILGAGHQGGAGYVAREFQEALSGNVRNTQMLNKMLLEPALEKAGKSIKEWNTMTSEDRVKIFMSAINDPAWDAAIAKQRDSYLGLTSTLKDNFEILARETGEKFFDKIKGGLKELNGWIDKHPKEIAEFTTKIADGLSKAFDAAKSAFGFIVDHKDLLLKIAEMWAVGKVTGAFGGAGGVLGMLPGALSGGGLSGLAGLRQNASFLGSTAAFTGGQYNAFAQNGVGSMAKGALIGYGLNSLTGDPSKGIGLFGVELGKVNTGMMAFEGALSQMPGPLGLIGTAALALHAALNLVAEAVDDNHKKQVGIQADYNVIRDNALKGGRNQEVQAAVLLKEAMSLGLINGKGEFENSRSKANDILLATTAGLSSEAREAAGLEIPKIVDSMRALVESLGNDEVMKRLHLGGTDQKPTDVSTGKKKDAGTTNIHIHKIEVPASDPDRFVHSLIKKFDRAAKNPTAADRVLRGGF